MILRIRTVPNQKPMIGRVTWTAIGLAGTEMTGQQNPVFNCGEKSGSYRSCSRFETIDAKKRRRATSPKRRGFLRAEKTGFACCSNTSSACCQPFRTMPLNPRVGYASESMRLFDISQERKLLHRVSGLGPDYMPLPLHKRIGIETR